MIYRFQWFCLIFFGSFSTHSSLIRWLPFLKFHILGCWLQVQVVTGIRTYLKIFVFCKTNIHMDCGTQGKSPKAPHFLRHLVFFSLASWCNEFPKNNLQLPYYIRDLPKKKFWSSSLHCWCFWQWQEVRMSTVTDH